MLQGLLHAHSCTATRHIVGVQAGLHTLAVPHERNTTCAPNEVAAVVTPYNVQVRALPRAFGDAGLGCVRAGTVDRFQGQEAPRR